MYDQNNPMNQFLNAPGMAMAGQAMNNMYAMRRGQAPRMDPFQAYQQSVFTQSQMANRSKEMELRTAQESRAAALHPFQLQKAEQDADPYYAFEEGKRRGTIPQDMTYQQFEQIGVRASDRTSVQKNMEMWRALNTGATPEQEQAAFAALARPTSIYGGGGGSQYTYNALNPNSEALVDAPTATDRDAANKGATKDAEVWATADEAWESAFNESAPNLDNAIGKVNEMIAYIEANPNMDTGMLEGMWSAKTDEIVAYMDTMSSQLTVPALAAAKLNPVTEQEWEAIKGTFSSPKRDPAANIAALRATLEWMTSKGQMMQGIQSHYQDNGTTKGYASGYKFKNLGAPQGAGSGKIKGPARPGAQ